MYLLFFFAWIIFNGRITAEIVLFGIVIAAAVFAFVCKFMNYSLQKEKIFYKKIFSFCRYIVLLLNEIFKANVAVCHLILTGREEIEPIIVKFHTRLKTDTARVMLANSITLTPGTITVSLEDDELVVHCLDKSLAEGMENSEFVSLLEELEGEDA